MLESLLTSPFVDRANGILGPGSSVGHIETIYYEFYQLILKSPAWRHFHIPVNSRFTQIVTG
jgi:hypothetical protein